MQKQRFRLRNNFILNILFSFSSFVLALFGFLAVLPPASEPEVSAIIDGEQFALTITNSEAINLEINPTESGSIAVAKDTIVANTNSPAGYKLYVSTDSESSNDIHLNGRESNDTEDKKIIAASGTFNAPAALNQNESSWGFALAGVNGFDSSYDIANPSPSAKFAAVPEKNNEQLIHDHTGRATDDETEIYFAAKANTSIASGNYQTTILYTTLSEATDQDQTEINLENTIFTTNYETEGNRTVTVNTSIVSSKTPNLVVKINDIEVENLIVTNIAPLSFTFNLPANLADGTYDLLITLTNLAKSYTKQKAIGIYKPMQNMTPEFCESMTLEEQKQFIDLRDNKVYFAAKLKDGNCWMTQNLDYDLSVQANQTLTPATSNVTENRTVVPANTDLTTFKTDTNAIYYLDGGDIYYTNGTTKTEDYSTLPANDINRHYAGGDYYSWKAATAGQGTTDITTEQDVNESICPAGWRLPTGNSADANYSFGNLVKQYGYTGTNGSTSDTTLLASPLFFARSGYILSSLTYGQGGYGDYWSSRAKADSNSNYRAHALNFNSGFVGPNYFNYRYYGFSVRCVAKKGIQTITIKDNLTDETISTLNFEASINLPEAPAKEGYVFVGYTRDRNAINTQYRAGSIVTEEVNLYPTYLPIMQNISELKNTLVAGQSIQMVDIRDNKIYWVTKYEDGNIFMTQDLDFDLSNTSNQILKPETSNVAETRTISADIVTGYHEEGDYYYENGNSKKGGLLSLEVGDTNSHYAVGDTYSWTAATAGYGTATTADVDAVGSICPAGWKLPTFSQVRTFFEETILGHELKGDTSTGCVDMPCYSEGVDTANNFLAKSEDVGVMNFYWTSTVMKQDSVGFWQVASDTVYFYNANQTTNDGLINIRCVAK